MGGDVDEVETHLLTSCDSAITWFTRRSASESSIRRLINTVISEENTVPCKEKTLAAGSTVTQV